jgi:hypothetical protein
VSTVDAADQASKMADFYRSIDREADREWDRSRKMRDRSGMEREDFRAEVRARVLASSARFWSRDMIRQEAKMVSQKLKRQKRFAGEVEPLLDKHQEVAAVGGRWDAANRMAGLEALIRLENPVTGERLTREEVRLVSAVLALL